MLAVFMTVLLSREVWSSERKCERLDIDICKTGDQSYSYAGFPNNIGHTTQEIAKSEMKFLQPLIDSGCSSDIVTFLCSLYAPYCDLSNETKVVEPCRDLCLNIFERCGKDMIERSVEWPNTWKCGRFSDWSSTHKCIKGKEARPTTKPPEVIPTTKEITVTHKNSKHTEGISNEDTEADICNGEQLFCDNKCISLSFRCDDYDDCNDGTDEQNCDKCLSKQFRCSDGLKCITLSGKCDGFADCADQSDEKDCNQCSGTEFLCDRARCIPLSMKCDSRRDCSDGTDEMNCGSCQPYEFICNNNRCVSKSVTCDNSDDCGDNSDENLPSCYNIVDGDKDTDDGEDNKTEEGQMTCKLAKDKCYESDPDCLKAAKDFRAHCEKQMASESLSECTKACHLAYNVLAKSAPHGTFLVDQRCKEMYVENVERSCIRQPVSHECLAELQECSRNPVCQNLYKVYSDRCDAVLNTHDICTDQCSDAYSQLVDSPLSKDIKANCIEVNTTIKLRCPQYFSRKESSATSLSSVLSAIAFLILTLSSLFLPR